MTSITYLPGRETPLDQITERLLRILDGRVPQRSKNVIEVNYRNRLERTAKLIDGGLKITAPEVPGVDQETVCRVLEAVRPAMTEDANKLFSLLIGELLALEVENWELQNGKTD